MVEVHDDDGNDKIGYYYREKKIQILIGEMTTMDVISAVSFVSSHRFIFVAIFLLHLIQKFIDYGTKRGAKTSELIQLRQEINQLLREANSLSTPSTFAQAAKLRRMAAFKEKELTKYQEGQNQEHGWSFCLSGKCLLFIKVVLCLWLTWKFWGVPVIVVPSRLLQPFGKMLSWSTTDPSTGLIPVGIIPWLLLSNQVSNVLCRKFFNVVHL